MAPPQNIDISAGLVPNAAPTAAATGPAIDLSAGLVPNDAATSVPPKSWTDSLGDFASHLWNQVNPVAGVEGAAQLAAHPIDTYKNDVKARSQVLDEAEQSFKSGDYAKGTAKLLYAFAPFVGPQLNQAANDFANGKIAAGLGTSTGTGLSMAGPDAIGDVALRVPGVESAAELLYRKALKPSLAANTGAQIGDMVRTGLQDKIPVSAEGSAKISDLMDDLNDKIKAQIASSPNATVNAFDVADRLKDTAKKFQTQVNPTADLQAIRESGAEFLQNNPTDIPASRAQELKQGTYQQIKDRAYGELGTAATESQKALARGLKEELQTQFPEIGSLNAHESKLIGLDEAVDRRVQQLANRSLLPGGVWSGALLGGSTGAIGGAASGVEGAALGAAAGMLKRVIEDPMVQSKLAIAMHQGSKARVSIPVAMLRLNAYTNLLGNAVESPQEQPAPAQ
jgi:hypothetical protein